MNILAKSDFEIKKIVFVTAVVFSLVFSATPVFARENERNDDRREDRKEEKVKKAGKKDDDEKRGWAFGHFIAPGWIKKNGQAVLPNDVRFPAGVWKKFFGNNGTSTNSTSTTDTTAPVISGVQINPQSNRAVVRFITNEKSDSAAYLSTSTPVNVASTSVVVSSNVRVLKHEIVLKDLASSTTYYLVVRARDNAGNISYSSQLSFTTSPGTVVLDTTAPKLSNVYAVVGTSTVAVNWLTNEPATSKIFYGTVFPIDTQSSTTARVENTTLATSHSLTLSALATSTKYYFTIESRDSSGNMKKSSDYYVVTSGI